MRHQKKVPTLDRKRGPRRALLKTLTRSLVFESRIQTTDAKAKAVQVMVERLITRSKTQSLAVRRILIERTGSTEVADRLLQTIGPKYRERKGGYTRITHIGPRKGDGGKIVLLELV